MKKLLLRSTVLALMCGMLAGVGSAGAAPQKPIRLKMVTQYMDRHVMVQKVYKPWIEEIKKRTNGRVIIQLYNPNTIIPDGEVFNGLLKNQIDIADHFYTRFPGVFPACTVTSKIPMVASNATTASYAFWEMFETIPETINEMKGAKLLAVHGSCPLHVTSSKKEIKTLEDLKGHRLLSGGKDGALIAKSLGIEGIMQPGPDMYMALNRNMGDGVIYPIPPMRSFKIDEVTKSILMSSLVMTPCFFAMSESSWNKLPDDIKTVFEETTGKAMSVKMGEILDAGEKEDLAVLESAGIKINYLSSEERAQWQATLMPALKEAWLEEVKGRLADPEALYDGVLALFEKYEAEHGGK